MLAEFVLTPNLFSGADEELRARLLNLRELLLPRRGAPVALVCRLGKERWERAVVKAIGSISNSSLRSDAQQLFLKLNDLTVERPCEHELTTATEQVWVECALTSHAIAPLDTVVTSSKFEQQLCKDMAAFSSDEFWQAYENPRPVARTVVAQTPVLRTLCQHARWIIVRMPQIRGGNDDEIVTVKQIVGLASQRLSEQDRCMIEVQICVHGKSSEDLKLPDRQKQLEDSLLRNVRKELEDQRRALELLRISVLPPESILNRELIAGDWAQMSDNTRRYRARWYISMTHVAVGERRRAIGDTAGNSWSLFDRRRAHERLEELQAIVAVCQAEMEGVKC